jgi:hypothetical protein
MRVYLCPVCKSGDVIWTMAGDPTQVSEKGTYLNFFGTQPLCNDCGATGPICPFMKKGQDFRKPTMWPWLVSERVNQQRPFYQFTPWSHGAPPHMTIDAEGHVTVHRDIGEDEEHTRVLVETNWSTPTAAQLIAIADMLAPQRHRAVHFLGTLEDYTSAITAIDMVRARQDVKLPGGLE